MKIIMVASYRRILLVDDSPKDIELTIEALRDSGLSNEIDTAGDGEEALDFIYRRGRFKDRTGGDPAVILLDIKMPKVDGLEVLKHIKSDPAIKHIPVVILTSSREEADLARSYALGVNAYVVKPVGFSEFLDGIRQVGLFWAILNELPGEKGN